MNHLANEASLYLKQHAAQPVDWYPWGEEALRAAREQGKPILLSIGYSACHWCHVMAHECFDDPGIAEKMNALFINIKVDREERPDLDKIYQQAHYLLNQRGGGWPLNVVLTHDDQVPFFSGTYFPKEPRYGMPAFADVLQKVADYYHGHPAEIRSQNARLVAFLERPAARAESPISDEAARQAVEALKNSFDARHGGFGAAPKFPHPSTLQFLLKRAVPHDADAASCRDMVLFSLECMARGGLVDQAGGGFFRYSVDERFEIPHFEKMLYDNGPLLWLYAKLAAGGPPLFSDVAHGLAQWVLREMRDAQGGFYATLDADSEGEEGKFYLWTPEQLDQVLTPAESRFAKECFGMHRPANFEGRWHLQRIKDKDQPAQQWRSVCQKLLAARAARVRPGRDEKRLTSWNALMIKGFAAAGRYLDHAPYIAAACEAVDFIANHVLRDGRLHAVYQNGAPRLAAYLDDYVFLIDALLELMQARWRDGDVRLAQTLAETVVQRYFSQERNAFYFTASDSQALFHRPLHINDDALPAGNAVAADVFLRLGALLGREDWLRLGERVLQAAWPEVTQFPHAHCAMLSAAENLIHAKPYVVLRGRRDVMRQWQQHLTREPADPYTLAIAEECRDIPPSLDKPVLGDCVAYVCSAGTCSPPVQALEALVDLVKV